MENSIGYVIKIIQMVGTIGFLILFAKAIYTYIKIRKIKKEHSYNGQVNDLGKNKIKPLKNQIILNIALGVILYGIVGFLGSLQHIPCHIDI